MSTSVQSRNGTRPAARPEPLASGAEQSRLPALLSRLQALRAFVEVVLGYLLLVLPRARAEQARWAALAAEIPDNELRATAIGALAKRGNIEGAALFATLAPGGRRVAAIRALVAFQSAYNYLDALSEQPSDHAATNADQLHQALLCALAHDAPHPDYYAHCRHREDGGYLHAMLEECRRSLAQLPSFEALAPFAREAAARILDFQTLNLAERDGGHTEMRRWASAGTPPGSGLDWWETAAACGSSLSVHALIASSATPGLRGADARAIEAAYFPWAGALHSLLDSMVDRREDRESGRGCLLDHYGSTAHAAARLQTLAERASRAAGALEHSHRHRVILSAMCSYYLSAAQSHPAEARRVTRALRATLGHTLSAAVLMFAARRALNTALGHDYD